MATILRISDAVVLGLHACILIAKKPDTQHSVENLATVLEVSAAHLSKVMQRLVKSGVLVSRRGPAGGFIFAKPPREVRMIDVYEIIEGKLVFDNCLLGRQRCKPGNCLLGDFLNRTAAELVKTLSIDFETAASKADLGLD